MTRFRMMFVMILVLAGLAVSTAAVAEQLEEKTSGSRVHVGTFDSRAVAIVYYRSETHMKKLRNISINVNDSFDAMLPHGFLLQTLL